jgi:hypothetical protein
MAIFLSILIIPPTLNTGAGAILLLDNIVLNEP